jgi:26S proteasome regulatory subunit N3
MMMMMMMMVMMKLTCVSLQENTDVYSTQEPQAAFHRRIEFCLNTHNEAVKAMRFPPEAHKPSSVESAKERREREQEIAKNLAEDEEDF